MKEERDLSYYTFKQANELGMMLYFKKDVSIIREYIDKILRIPNLFEIEQRIWNLSLEVINITGTYSIANVRDIFRDNRILTYEEISELENQEIVNQLDEAIDNYIALYRRKEVFDAMAKWLEDFRLGRHINSKEVIDTIENFDYQTFEIGNTLSKLEENYNQETDNTKITTCIKYIDNIGATFRKGTINTILGFTGSYKTMYCTNVAYNAIKQGLNTCYISLEISASNMYYNFLSRYSNEPDFKYRISHTKIKNKDLDNDEKKYLFTDMVEKFKNQLDNHLIIVDETNLNIKDFTSFDAVLKKIDDEFIKRTNKGVDVVIIDHLNLLKFDETNQMNDYSKVNHWMSYFRKNCINFVRKDKQVCFIIAAQSNRSGYERAMANGGSYTLDSIAEGNEIERSSAVVLGLYTDAGLKKQELAKIQVIKGRDCGEMERPIEISVQPTYYLVKDHDNGKISNEEDILLIR